MVLRPKEAFIIGGTWRIPILAGLQEKETIDALKRDEGFNEIIFDREYESKWAGASEDAFFNSEDFDRNRTIQKPEYEYSGRSSLDSYYIISADIGRKGDNSAFLVIKVKPQPNGPAIKQVVNLYSYADMPFEEQTIILKQLYYKYKARQIVLDGNGIGIAILDCMVKKQYIEGSDITLPDFGITNDKEGYYKKYKTPDCEDNAVFVVKAQAPLNTEAYTTVQANLSSGKIKFLLDERHAKNKLMATAAGKAMSPEQRAEYLLPYALTDILKLEMMNLREENEGVNIILKRVTRKVHKDKFSALAYALYYIRQIEDTKKKKRNRNFKDWKFFN